VVSSAGLNGTVYAEFDHSFPSGIVVPILSSADSGTFGDVTLTQGAMNSFGIIPVGKLDLIVDIYVR
jgi:hypothetical protein